jgi:DNA-binding response OmpR family regulator
LQELEAAQRKPKVIIIVTARDDIEDRMKTFNFGIDDYIVKPFNFKDLLAKVKEKLVR